MSDSLITRRANKLKPGDVIGHGYQSNGYSPVLVRVLDVDTDYFTPDGPAVLVTFVGPTTGDPTCKILGQTEKVAAIRRPRKAAA